MPNPVRHRVCLMQCWSKCLSQHVSTFPFLYCICLHLLLSHLSVLCFPAANVLPLFISFLWLFVPYSLFLSISFLSDLVLLPFFTLWLCSCCLFNFFLFLSQFLFRRKARDSLPSFRQFFSSAFSLTYVSLASMKVPPDSLRWVTVAGL